MRHNACASCAMSRELIVMVFVQRPSHWIELLRLMIAPVIVPDILAAPKVNLGNASRESRSPRSMNPPPGGRARVPPAA
jgi:hypothetical protein